MKPSFGAVAWPGARQCAPTLDTLGWYGRSAKCLTLMARAFHLRGLEGGARIRLESITVGLAKTHNWEKTEASARNAVGRAARLLEDAGARIIELALPAEFAGLNRDVEIIMQAEGGIHFLPEYLERRADLHPDFHAKVEGGATIPTEDLRQAYDHAATCRIAFDALFGANLDVIVTPAATGEAPLGLHGTGNWIMNSIWTLLHAPCIAIPGHLGENGMPVGVQIVGPRFADARLLAIGEAFASVLDPSAAAA
jgi:Asp-tRNA(Asn)/Glu-tRNA(Gln) amidotransferase A subunit family amidase